MIIGFVEVFLGNIPRMDIRSSIICTFRQMDVARQLTVIHGNCISMTVYAKCEPCSPILTVSRHARAEGRPPVHIARIINSLSRQKWAGFGHINRRSDGALT